MRLRNPEIADFEKRFCQIFRFERKHRRSQTATERLSVCFVGYYYFYGTDRCAIPDLSKISLAETQTICPSTTILFS